MVTIAVSPEIPLPTWTVGYLDAGGDERLASLPPDRPGYEIRRIATEEVVDERLDALVVETLALAEGDDALLDAIDAAPVSLVVAVGGGTPLRVPETALGVVDEHVTVVESLDPLWSVLESAREERWSNLGLSAEALVETIFEDAPIHLYLKDEDARHTRASHPYEKEYDLIGKTDTEAYPNPRLAGQAEADDRRVIDTGEPVLEKEEYDEDDGTWTVCSKVPVENDEGETVGLLGVSKHITERKEAQHDLERQIDRLEEFANILSHDLRNPLSITLGRAELASETYPDDEHVESILRNVKRMGAIIEDVLTMTKQGRQIESTERVSLRTVAAESWEHAGGDEDALTVVDELTLEAAEGRLRHLFENLFDNAVEHGGSDVSVAVEPLDDGDGFAVTDDGPGIPPAERNEVFEQGYTTADDGTGLGLNIVEQVVEAHGWEIEVVESEDGGARFEIWGLDGEPL